MPLGIFEISPEIVFFLQILYYAIWHLFLWTLLLHSPPSQMPWDRILQVSKDQLDATNSPASWTQWAKVSSWPSQDQQGQAHSEWLLSPPNYQRSLQTLEHMYNGSRGKKFEEWWAHVHAWQSENATILQGAASIHTILSRMVDEDARTFACAQLKEMIREKQWTWAEFTTLVEGNFWSTNDDRLSKG